MALTGSEDAWQRTCFVEITSGSTAVMQLRALTSSISDISLKRGMEIIKLMNLGMIVKHTGFEEVSFSIEGYCKQAGTATTGAATGVWDLFAGTPLMDAAQPLVNILSNTITRYRVAILWTDDDAATTGGQATAASTNGKRFVIADCYINEVHEDFSDGILKFTLNIWGAPMDIAAAGNVKWESGVATAIPVLAAYVAGTTKW